MRQKKKQNRDKIETKEIPLYKRETKYLRGVALGLEAVGLADFNVHCVF